MGLEAFKGVDVGIGFDGVTGVSEGLPSSCGTVVVKENGSKAFDGRLSAIFVCLRTSRLR